MARLGDLIEQIRGVSYKPEDVYDELNENSVALLRANNIKEGLLNFDDVIYVDKKRVRDHQLLKAGDILICTSSGSRELVGKAAYVQENLPMTFGAFCKVVRSQKIRSDYLGHFFNSPNYRQKISDASAGANINNIRNEHIDELEILLPAIEKQEYVAVVLDKLSSLISLRKQQLTKLDELVKARFVEMFGDPVLKDEGIPMTKLCEIIDGDRGQNYPKQEEFFEQGYCLFLNAKNVTSSGFSFENCMFITEKKDNMLRKGKLCRGDIVLTTRGTIGNLAFYDDTVPFEHIRINSGMVILRINRELLTEEFFIEQFRMLLVSVKEKIASGSAQPQLPISTMHNILMLLPNVKEQNKFSGLVQKINRQKLTIQQSLNKLEVLKKALMQEYFG